jgi:RNA polymerase sigma-70 factor (ECF subfamily)
MVEFRRLKDAQNDVELLDAWRAGDRAAGDELVRRHFDAVQRFVAAYNNADPEELTQRTFAACVEGRDRIRDGSSLRGYLLGTARRLLIKSWDAKKRVAVTTPSRLDIAAPNTTPTQRISREDERRMFTQALASLPDEFRETVERFYLREESLKQIAAELDIAVGTVKSRLSRGRLLLRQAIERRASDPETRGCLVARLSEAGE